MTKNDAFRILLVDDEFYLRQSLKRRISKLDGFTVIGEAANGREALDFIQKNNVQVCITDIRMPVMDGLELTKQLHESNSDVITIILTGYADFDYAQEALRQGVRDYLLKPVKTEDLLETLELVRSDLLAKAEDADDADEELEENFTYQSSEEAVNYIVRYMNKHFRNDLDIGSLAESIGFTNAYLTKLFNRYIGESPSKYLTHLRIEKAKQLLESTDLSISAVGECVGYPDQFHFSKTFRKITDQNPSAYRREHKQF